MAQQFTSVCYRCGKQRVVIKTWKETVGTSTLTRTTMRCPDKECQKIVDKELFAREEKRLADEERKRQRTANRSQATPK